MPFKKCRYCQVDTLWMSWSGLRTFDECKQKGMLSKGGHRASLENQRIFFPGSVVDRAMRNWLSADPENNKGGMVASITDTLKSEEEAIRESGGVMRWKNAEDQKNVEATCIEAATKLEPILFEKVVPFLYQPAMRFKAPLMLPSPDGVMEEVILNGEMDIILENDEGEYEVWDLKITRDNNYWRKTVGQLTFYDMCTQIMMGKPTITTGLIQPLCDQQVLPYHITEDLRSQMYSRVIRMANAYWREDFEPRKDTKICGYCAVRHACSKFAPVNDGKNRRVKLI